MNTDLEFHIKHNYTWARLPLSIRSQLHDSERLYAREVYHYSIRHQLELKKNIVQSFLKKFIKKTQQDYYMDLLHFSREHLMLYPYHLQEIMVRGLRTTPFAYYLEILKEIMQAERSYDCLPNFTAADCLRLLGIGRNQYIDLMNKYRATRKIFGMVGVRRHNARDLLPTQPLETLTLDPWWFVHLGKVMEEDVGVISVSERRMIDKLYEMHMKKEQCQLGMLELPVVRKLYCRGLVYLDVPIEDRDCIVVPTLEGFVMNRVTGDYFETLLYKIFVSIDENTTVAELANVLDISLDLVKNAISMFCRLGFAFKKVEDKGPWHSSWEGATTVRSVSTVVANVDRTQKKVAFLFDSTLTAYLMMGNLSPGLKNHAVTMFEVGKLSDEIMENFLVELDLVKDVGEGEAARYFQHAFNLRDTVRALRHNESLTGGAGLDLLRTESLLSLEPAARLRILSRNYTNLVSMAPMSAEDHTLAVCAPPHLGPPGPEVNSIWFKLFLYKLTGSGPPSLLLVRGARLRCLPESLRNFEFFLVTTWGHDPGLVPASNLLITVNEALTHAAVLVQACLLGERRHICFPSFIDVNAIGDVIDNSIDKDSKIVETQMPAVVIKLRDELQLDIQAGFLTLLADDTLLELHLGIPLFDSQLNKAVCRGMDSHNLLSLDNSALLLRAQRRLMLRLLDFIARLNLGLNGGYAISNSISSCSESDYNHDVEVPFPTCNLLFFEGNLSPLRM